MIEVLKWLEESHKKRETELIKQVKTSEEELKVKTTKYSEELKSKINQIKEITSLMDTNHNEIIRLKNEIIKQKEEVQFLEINKNKEFDHLKNEYEKQILALQNELIATNTHFAQVQAQLTKKHAEEKKINSSNQQEYEKEILTLKNKLEATKKELIALETQEKLSKEQQDNLLKTIEKKERDLLIFGSKINQQNQSMHNLKTQYKELNDSWKQAKEEKRKAEASLYKIDLISSDRLEMLKKQFLPSPGL